YDYYQPEAYVAARDLYIEKETDINKEIERMRLAATTSLMEREDVLIVSSVSCIYGLGNPGSFKDMRLMLHPGDTLKPDTIIDRLIQMQYGRDDITFSPGNFRKRGDSLDVYLAYYDEAYRIEFDFDTIASIKQIHPLTAAVLGTRDYLTIYPAKHFVMEKEQMYAAINNIEAEMKEQIKFFEDRNRLVEALRIKQKTMYDLEMLRELGSCAGIENYSRHLSYRAAGERPATMIDYFPDDFLLFIDESHVSVSQIGAMYEGDKSRKQNLVDFGFRLPSALDNRPLKIGEFENIIPQTLYVSATPGKLELERCPLPTELIIRPTGLLDPQIEVRPTKGQIEDLYAEIRKRVDLGERSLVLTLTKKMAEDMADYFSDLGLSTRYLHSEIDTIERVEILRDLRLGKFDVLIGVNLLREGIDLPEVTLIAIMDADKIGFLRSTTSLIQIIGRAARNSAGIALMYADKMSPAMTAAIDETNRRRVIQEAYNKEHGITPATIKKAIHDILEREEQEKLDAARDNIDIVRKGTNLFDKKAVAKLIKRLEKEMLEKAKNLEFEEAALLRDEVEKLRKGEV
ncbi:MAG: excinuclease ABC subunit B, partial [Spirochaetaceae bacterium]|nr:excinuclease ABC subunit B [Spirochaetaceae bacterium]